MNNIDTLIKEITKDIDLIGTLDTLDNLRKPDVIPFGIQSLDSILGIGGIPRGMLIEIYGPESTAKTSICLSLVSNAQKLGIKVAFIDAEMAISKELALMAGVDTSDMLVARPVNGEEALELVENFANKGYGLIVVDSVSAMTPESELERDYNEETIGLQARMMSKAMRKIVGLISRTNTAVVFINQIRDEVNKIGYGDKTTTSGGRALKFYSALRLKMARIGWIKKGEEKVGMEIRVVVAKNKLSRPQLQTDLEFMWGSGFNVTIDKLNTLIATGKVELVGRTYIINGQKKTKAEITEAIQKGDL